MANADVERVRRWRQSGDQQAVSDLWTAYQRTAVYVAGQILVRVRNGQEIAREIADEAFLKALERFDVDKVGQAGKPFRSFYVLVARRMALDRLRKEPVFVNPDDVPELEAPEPYEEPEELPYQAREVLPRLKAFVLDNYLPSDWALFEVWMRYQREGKRVPWASIVEEHPIEIHDVIRFGAGTDVPVDAEGALAAAAHTMNVSTGIQVQVNAFATPDEGEDLARRRAEVVRKALEARLQQKVLTDRKTKETEPRLLARGVTRDGPPLAEFDVVRGRVRSPAALRMRIQKVILEKVRELLAEDGAAS